jgi:hypothetical protein
MTSSNAAEVEKDALAVDEAESNPTVSEQAAEPELVCVQVWLPILVEAMVMIDANAPRAAASKAASGSSLFVIETTLFQTCVSQKIEFVA